MQLPLKTLEPNTAGRDFVISDLHGSYSIFMNLLLNIKFNPLVDRIISVGDLVDRGPDSLSCLALLREPWFHAVFANHEELMTEKFRGGYRGGYWYQNGGTWGMEAYNDYRAVYIDHTRSFPSDQSAEIIDLLPLAEQLPYLITVKMSDGRKFHVVHAELPYLRGAITDRMLEDPVEVNRLAKIKLGDGDSFLWSRWIFGAFSVQDNDYTEALYTAKCRDVDTFFSDQLSHVISGHTIMTQPVTVIGQTCIDTGAYKSYQAPVQPYASGGQLPPAWAGLTCVELATWKFYKATADSFAQVDPYVVTAEDIAGAL